jgi:hypothetical protein
MKIIRGTIFGGIFYFFLGWVVYGMLLMDFFTSGLNQCLSRPMGDMVWWAMIASNLFATLFLTLFLYWSKAKSIVEGLLTGALFGFLFAGMINLSYWSMTTMFSSFTMLLADMAVSIAVFALTGMIVVLTWGKK